MKEEKRYQEKYCEKHNQHFADFLNGCPICVRERYAMENKKSYTVQQKEKEAD